MTEERDIEQAGAAIDEANATETEVMEAARRAIDPIDADVNTTVAGGDSPADVAAVPVVESADALPQEDVQATAAAVDSLPAISDLDMPSAAPAPVHDVPAVAVPTDAEQIQVPTDHPMAGFYVQTPLPPEVRGNRGAGVLIALVATVGFALVYAGVIAAWIAPVYPPSTFLTEGLLPYVTSWGFIFAVAGFFVGLSVLVLIVGRAGWWAYMLGGFFVAVLVWAAAIVGYALARETFDIVITGQEPIEIVQLIGLSIPALLAAVVARETSVWFGAWIGARGRKMKLKNREALAEYDARVAETPAS